jgi:DNA-3-methyladenine glycosylase
MKEFYFLGNRLQKDFFMRATEKVAKELIGKILVRKYDNNYLAGEIVETEAYLPEGDMANHSAIAQTKRNAPMREEGGILYVYKIYGIHHCVNIVTEEKGRGAAVLLRALKPLHGIEIIQKLRNKFDIDILCKGPGNLAKAMNFDTDDNYKRVYDNDEIFVLDNKTKYDIIEDERIGISKSKELLLRYYAKSCNFVSGKTKKY